MLEPGLYIAFATGSADRPRPKDEGAVVLEAGGNPNERTSCAVRPCDYGQATVPGTASAGLNLFAGYAFTESLRAGVRVIAGAMFSGGSVWAFGPSLGLRATNALTFGAFGAFWQRDDQRLRLGGSADRLPSAALHARPR